MKPFVSFSTFIVPPLAKLKNQGSMVIIPQETKSVNLVNHLQKFCLIQCESGNIWPGQTRKIQVVLKAPDFCNHPEGNLPLPPPPGRKVSQRWLKKWKAYLSRSGVGSFCVATTQKKKKQIYLYVCVILFFNCCLGF